MTTPITSIRADANPRIGYGHIMRTLAVAKKLVEENRFNVRFFVAADSDDQIVVDNGFSPHMLQGSGIGLEEMLACLNPDDGPILLDSYQVKERDLLHLRQLGYKVAMFDDGKRLEDYPCDLVIDSAPDAKQLPYKSSTDAVFCLGAEYYPLRQEFLDYGQDRTVSDQVKNILVTFGGSDPTDQTARVLRLLSQVTSEYHITAIVGNGYTGVAVEFFGAESGIEIFRNVKDMALLLQNVDIAVSSSGGTAFELAYSGVPAMLISLTDDQVPVAMAMERVGCASYVGHWNECTDEDIQYSLSLLLSTKDIRISQTIAGKKLIDGNGAERISIFVTGMV